MIRFWAISCTHGAILNHHRCNAKLRTQHEGAMLSSPPHFIKRDDKTNRLMKRKQEDQINSNIALVLIIIQNV